ncbi:hypothetical protein WKR88_04835 [Trinickia caryophylli]|uniref:Uncharacterized protein n=1 Tax=Trinickia caryophylli TaxID=28094 RepID=A0A1X7FCW1_TRICW|nr:hypothetical protein [Trinickia caryophylli]PMS10887.1 hypothetical protein C0Z17_17045 [Trinickia caryophylli]TRX18829.1 hypothetical protein FNF07_11750 [Trinickia caryophylli]WQE10371.1 hypothetical protein U0034_11165 [Trinickia caryophylli]SMF49850.1 hypothetical protein SAMN06295900_108186 [Trinickia caryophylli]GLU34179.1 hypothetical protein Busp01_40210 [Trinickia caryophylli]
MLCPNSTWRRVQAIRHGIDDRLLVLIEADHPTLCAIEMARHLRTWRNAYGGELEILALVRKTRIESVTRGDHRRAAVARRLHALGVPVAIGIDAGNPLGPAAPSWPLAAGIVRWNWLDNDGAAHPALVADTHVRGGDDASATIIGCQTGAEAHRHMTLASETAACIAHGDASACGLVLRILPISCGAPAGEHQPLLSRLAGAVRQRRVSPRAQRPRHGVVHRHTEPRAQFL